MTSKISLYNQSTEIGIEEVSSVTQEIAPGSGDAQWFMDAISSTDESRSVGDRIFENFDGIADHLKSRRNEVDENLKVSTATDDYGQLMSSFKDMSDYGFQTALAAKVISKCTKAVEKITNLQ